MDLRGICDPMALRRPGRGAVIHGCVVLLGVMVIVTTFAMHYADRPLFHAVVAVGTLAGATISLVRTGLSTQCAAFMCVFVPAALSLVCAYSLDLDPETLKGGSAILYIAGSVIFLTVNGCRRLRARL